MEEALLLLYNHCRNYTSLVHQIIELQKLQPHSTILEKSIKHNTETLANIAEAMRLATPYLTGEKSNAATKEDRPHSDGAEDSSKPINPYDLYP